MTDHTNTSVSQKGLFGTETKPRELAFLEALKMSNNVPTEHAFSLIRLLTPAQFAQPWDVDTRMAFVECELDGASRTLGTQCLISLFDPGNGWIRCCNKRKYMLAMTAELVVKGVDLKGIYYYRNHPNVRDQSVELTVQRLIQIEGRRYDDPPAILNDTIIRIFSEAGYNFTYPNSSEFNNPRCSPSLSSFVG